MTVTPSGSPAWVRTNDHTNYGGHVDKANFLSQGVIDARTDVGADELARIAADLAAVARTAPFCNLTYTNDDSTPDDPTIDSYDAMTGSEPTASRNGDGDVTFTWSTAPTDDYGVTGSFNITHAVATVHGTAAGVAVCERLDTDSDGLYEELRVRCYTTSGVAMTDAKVTVTVYTGTG